MFSPGTIHQFLSTVFSLLSDSLLSKKGPLTFQIKNKSKINIYEKKTDITKYLKKSEDFYANL